MKFISVLRETHESDEDAIAHLIIPILIGEEEEVFPIYSVAGLWQLWPILAVAVGAKLGTSLSPTPGVREEAHREVAIGQLAYLPSPLQGGDAIHDEVFVLIHDNAKITIKNNPAKDTGQQAGASYFPRNIGLHLTCSSQRCVHECAT